MTTTEAADRLAAMYPGRLQSVAHFVTTMEDGGRRESWSMYVDGPGEMVTHAIERTPEEALDRIAPDTTEREEEQGDGEEDPYRWLREDLEQQGRAKEKAVAL
jgi:hypothetical protein